MRFAYNFYIFIIFSIPILQLIAGEEKFGDTELTRIAHKLNPMECMRLLEAIYLKKPMSNGQYFRSEAVATLGKVSIWRRQLENQEHCRDKLVEWSRGLPRASGKWARVTMESELRALGRPDLAKYVRRNRRLSRYFDEVSKNIGKRLTPGQRMHLKSNNLTTPGGVSNKFPKETVLQYYRKTEAAKSPDHESNSGRSERRKPEDDDSATRWTAFLVLLGVVALTILATVIFALYKKNRGNLCTIKDNCGQDRCPLADRFSCKPCETDFERGDVTGSSRYERKTSPSRSPSSICVREELPPRRKPKMPKCSKTRPDKAETIGKTSRRGCVKKCPGLSQRFANADKSTKTREPKYSEKCNQSDNGSRPRLELKKFQETITSILRREDPACKCCKCSVFMEKGKRDGAKCTSGARTKNTCVDEKCYKGRLKSIAELCLSRDETSPTDERKMRRTERKKKMNKRKKKKRSKENDCDEETDTEEEKESSPEYSARSKDKKESRTKKKSAGRGKKERCEFEEACTRRTCGFQRSNVD